MSKKTKTRLLIVATLLGLILLIGGEFLPKGAFDIGLGADKGVKGQMNLIQIVGIVFTFAPGAFGIVVWYFNRKQAELKSTVEQVIAEQKKGKK